MRALFVIRPDARTSFGGDTVQMDRTAEHLAALGVETERSVGPPTEEQLAQADVVHLFNLQTPDFTLAQLHRAKALAKQVAVSPVWWDFAADEVLQSSPKWAALRRVFGTRLVRPVLARRMRTVLRPQRSAHREILRRADLVLPNSATEAAQLRLLTPFPAPVRVVVNGVEPDGPEDGATAASLAPSGDFVFIAARVEPVKNQLAYLGGVATLGITVVCAGATTDPYATECARAGAVLLGRQDPAVVRALYRKAVLHALPSLRETPGLASLEAAAAGARIVSTEVGSARDYFGEFAEYCDPHDARSMRNATLRALQRPVTDELQRFVRERFTWQHAARQTLAAYESIL